MLKTFLDKPDMPKNSKLLTDNEVETALDAGPAALTELLLKRLKAAVGDQLTAETIKRLSVGQITLLVYGCFRREMMEGGMVQLIHNGYGPFVFDNPFAKVMKLWGLKDFSKMLYKARHLYVEHRDRLTQYCSEDDFMALYEQHPQLDNIDDEYIEKETAVTNDIAAYVAGHLQDFNEI